jgi:hypothetical protein
MQGGPRPACRPSDGRTARSDGARRVMAGALLDRLIDRGVFQPKFVQLGEAVGSAKGEAISRVFGARRLALTHLARIAPGRVVDALGLSPEARRALSDRDEKAIAWAVLAGKRLEAGQ